jgi:hypothetical protein
MNFYTKQIGPEDAAKLLTLNKDNRKINKGHIDFLVREIQLGNFKETGDTIKISSTGRLLDGQHRLNAIIKSGKTVPISFAEGLDDDTFTVIDTGKNRTGADILSLQNNKHPNEMSATIRLIVALENGKTSSSKIKLSNTEILKVSEKNPGLSEIVELVCTENRKFKMMPVSSIAALYYLFSKKNHSQCEDFFNKYYTGLDISSSHPVYQLRDKLIRDSTNKSKLSVMYKVAFTIVAWNHFVKDKTVKKLDFDPEKFPKVI